MSNRIVYNSDIPNYEEFNYLWEQMDWGEYNEELFKTIHSKEPYVVCARKENKLVGYCRLLTDYAMYGYVQDVMVDKSLRRQGIGDEMIKMLIIEGQQLGLKFLGLFSTVNAIEFYKSLGFLSLDNMNIGMGKLL